MRTTLRYFTPLFVAAGAAAAVLAAPIASAEPAPAPEPTPATAEAAAPGLLPNCVGTGGAEALGGSTTDCATPGNVQIDATPAEQEYVGPWGDMFGGGGGFFFP